jgi:hypothetical protein
MKEELIDEKWVFWSRSKNILPRHQIQACFDERAAILNGHNQISNNDHRRAVVAPCQYYSPLTYNEKVLYPARRTSEIAGRACGSKSYLEDNSKDLRGKHRHSVVESAQLA